MRATQSGVGRILFAVFLNATGSWASLIALWAFASYAYGINASTLGWLTLTWTAPGVALAPVVARALRRFSPPPILAVGFTVGLVASLLMLTFDGLVALFIAAAVFGISRGVVNPIVDGLAAWLPGNIPLLRANSWLAVSTEVAMVAGAGSSAALLALAGLRSVFAFDALTFIVAGWILVRSPFLRENSSEEARPAPTKLHLDAQTARVLVQLLGVYVVWAGFLVLEPLYVRDVLGRGQIAFSLLQLTYAAGVVVASVVAQRFRAGSVPAWSVAVACIAFGLSAGLYVGTPLLTVSAGGMFLWGVTSAAVLVIARTDVQARFARHRAGQVLALARGVNSATDIVMLPVAGFLVAGGIGVSRTGLLIAAVPVCLGLLGLALRSRYGSRPASQDGSTAGTCSQGREWVGPV